MFFSLKNTSEFVLENDTLIEGRWRENGPEMLQRWRPDADISKVEIPVDSVAEAYWRLGNLTSADIGRMQAALERQRPLLLYGREGRLQELLVQRVCWRAAALKRLSSGQRQT